MIHDKYSHDTAKTMDGNPSKCVRAVFLDRDGTIMEDRGHVCRVEDVVLYPFTVKALKLLQKTHLLFIVTNQSGISLGKISKELVDEVNLHVMSLLQSHGVTIQQVFCCSHTRADNCECIKPKQYFIKKACRDFNIDIKYSYSIGDHPHDVEFGEAAGGTGLYVLTGHGQKHRGELKTTAKCFTNLYHAAQWIINNPS